MQEAHEHYDVADDNRKELSGCMTCESTPT